MNYCEHGVQVSLLDYPPGRTQWQHGDNREAVRFVDPEERDEWARQGYSSGVHEIIRWVEEIHRYERRERTA